MIPIVIGHVIALALKCGHFLLYATAIPVLPVECYMCLHKTMHRRQGTFWRNEKVARLLQIMEELDMRDRVMPSTHFPNILFNRVVKNLTGFQWFGTQYRDKFKRVKAAFYEALEQWQGVPPMRARLSYFNSLHHLWNKARHLDWRERQHVSEL